jgi:hypothetical protein
MRRTVGSRLVSLVAAGLLVACAPASAQSGFTGTWRVDGVGPSLPWTVVLRADGPRVTGTVSQCANSPADVDEGRIEGNVVAFKCQNANGSRTITLTGTLVNDEIAFTWDVAARRQLLLPLSDNYFCRRRVCKGAALTTGRRSVVVVGRVVAV